MRTRYKLSISRQESKCHLHGDRFTRPLRSYKYYKTLIFLRCDTQRFNALTVSSILIVGITVFPKFASIYLRQIHPLKNMQIKKSHSSYSALSSLFSIFPLLHAVIALIYQHCRELRSLLLSLPSWLVR